MRHDAKDVNFSLCVAYKCDQSKFVSTDIEYANTLATSNHGLICLSEGRFNLREISPCRSLGHAIPFAYGAD